MLSTAAVINFLQHTLQ